jgi:hypothetical protein
MGRPWPLAIDRKGFVGDKKILSVALRVGYVYTIYNRLWFDVL